ncbi:MAG: TetR/AcrR family transcriptional regulator [Ferruginibacter sp.]
MELTQLKYRKPNLLDFGKIENIRGKATSLFSKDGTQSVSMDDIARHCRISKKTIYAFFGSKEILITEIVQILLAENIEALDKIQAASLDPIAEMEKLFDNLQKTTKILTPFLVGEIRQHYPNAYHLLRQFQNNKIRPFVIQNIIRGVNENIYRGNLDYESVSALYCWQLQNIYEATSAPIDVDKLLSQTSKLFLQGIIRNLPVAL